ncbi:hypothetical protein EG68_06540 [Paragonimus skrjabini miyazakii]|uniref:Glutaredoxin-like protein n=1 Tax=Paragonimus skrjabini miyazakii TaxID=59628 RepID=A0A8S9YP57_9TREM|nr:hypothetical protein EG68_06540 [Paragonimus skrjabini miyazakii]
MFPGQFGRSVFVSYRSFPQIQTVAPLRQYVSTMSVAKLPTLIVFTKPDCSLCKAALVQLQPYVNKHLLLHLIDITRTENARWLIYKNDIPVFHLRNTDAPSSSDPAGAYLMQHTIDWVRLKHTVTSLDQCPELDNY